MLHRSFREECQGSRAELVKKTKAFKAEADKADVPDGFKQSWPRLLKGYRDEINGLGQRAKSAEDAFLSVYKVLRDAPSPTIALQQAANLSPSK